MALARRAAKRDGRRIGRLGSVSSSRRKTQAASRISARPAPPTVLYRVCRSGWAVISEKVPSAPHTRFVCPFCPQSHRVPGPVRGFRRVRRPQWLKLRRVFE